ncbi:ArnT family glycosyltransferase [Ruminococcus sp. JL13D9]|uniref:ArnT family glycosyltransferase n=1 Tax=Ruminococcus sp. JL13D9 TaxID=3233381 RepID=UPI00389A3CCB
MQKISNFLIRAISVMFFAIVVFVLLASIWGFSEIISSGWMKYLIIGIVVFGIAFFCIFGENLFQKVYRLKGILNQISISKMFVFLFFFVLVTKVLLVFLLDNNANLHPDMKMYLSYATQLAEKGTITDNIAYALMFPYTVVYGWFLSPLVYIFGNDSKVCTTFLSVLFAFITILLFDIIRPYVGKNKAFLGLLIFNVLPVGLFETQLLVHETALLFFYVLSLWFFLKAINGKFNIFIKILMIIISALLISFGAMINQGGMVVIASYILLVIILFFRDRIAWKRILKLLSSVFCILICFFIVSNICDTFVHDHVQYIKGENERIERSVENRLPYAWIAYIGLNTDKPGTWNEEDRDTFEKYSEIEDSSEAKEYQINLVKGRLDEFLKSPWLIPGHLFSKMKSLWGTVFLSFAYEQGGAVNDFILHGMHGIIYKVFVLISYLTFITLCSVILLSVQKKKDCKTNPVCLPLVQFMMMIIGITLALILFEVMSKYVSHMQIIMFCIGIFCIDGFMDNSKKLHNRIFCKQKVKNNC